MPIEMHKKAIRTRVAGLGWLLALALVSCADLREREAGACGNAAIDEGEDCDLFAAPGGVCAAPGADNQCRYVCERGSGPSCPQGYGCGLDGVCRASSGAFAALEGEIAAPVEAMESGDFDGDGRDDLLLLSDDDLEGQRGVSLFFLEKGPRRLPLRLSSPHISENTGDGRADLTFSSSSGIVALAGREDGQIEPLILPDLLLPEGVFLRVFKADVFAERPGDELFFAHFDQAGLSLRAGDTGEAILKVPGVTFGELREPVAIGSLDPAAPCPVVALSPAKLPLVVLWSTCSVEGGKVRWNSSGSPLQLSFPAGAEAAGAARLIDIDGDGHNDLLIPIRDGALLALGDGKGGFVAQQGGPFSKIAAPGELEGEPPLAVGDINGDHSVDFVSGSAVLLSEKESHRVAFRKGGEPWTTARIADMNGDGLLDVVAFSAGQPGVEELMQSAGGVLTRHGLETTAPVELIAVDDLDGDSIVDLLIATHEQGEGHAPAGEGAGGAGEGQDKERGEVHRDDLLASYGRLISFAEQPAFVATTGEVEQLETAHLAHGGPPDRTADLLLVNEGAADSLSRLQSRGNRQYLAPFSLEKGDQRGKPLATLATRVEGQTTYFSVARGEDGRLRVWALKALSGATESSVIISDPLPEDFLGDEAIDDDSGLLLGVHEADEPGEQILYALASRSGAPGQGLLVNVRFLGDRFELGEARPFQGSLTSDSKAFYGGLAGARRLYLLTGSVEAPGPVLVFSETSGDLFGDVEATLAGPFSDMTCQPLPGKQGCLPLLAAGDGALAHRGGQLSPVEGLPPAAVITSGDFDGDGLADVALGGEDGVRLFRSIPVRP